MQIITQISIKADERASRLVVDCKFLNKAIASRRLVVSVGKISYSNTLGTILSSYPISIGQIDADSR